MLTAFDKVVSIQSIRLYFHRETMKAFGDTMRNYGVKMVEIELDNAFNHDGSRARANVWELYRRRPVDEGLNSSAFFAMDDFRLIRPRRVFMDWDGFNA